MNRVCAQEHYDLLIREGNDPVLEIGVGTGRLALKVLAAGCRRFTGIDLSPLTAERAREHLKEFKNALILCGDFLSNEFCESYDILYCSLSLFHFQNKAAFVENAESLLRPGGRLVVSIPRKKRISWIWATGSSTCTRTTPALSVRC
jgi:2-polyprenyl-3-methyl-5-hydroxy-6-metoxy-1,4-benzoquinol methylase